MRKVTIALIACILLLVICVYLLVNYPIKQACYKETCFDVHVADDDLERQKGLSVFESLPENEGMLFIFEEEQKLSFWMKDMNFPIDIIWLDANSRIVHVEKNLQPCTLEVCPTHTPEEDAKYVLEINANLTERYGIELGEYVDFR